MEDGGEGWSNEEAFLVEECDPDYEFDAARFYDFGRSETCSDVEAAERWFDSAGTYPPSRKH
ncbi:Aminotran_1_2 domain-containing protein [Psidium guajava]|nr:Aminotran_1_2 domain-containing protein [Psidium guajava]